MKAPTDAQGRFLALIHDRSEDHDYGDRRFVGRTAVWTHSAASGYCLGRHKTATVAVCARAGWLEIDPDDAEARLTEDGIIALGLWRQRKLARPPAGMPTLSDREREVAELAQRALELGYALCPRKPARAEARRMRRAGWFSPHGCWVANNADGLVPTPMAIVELRPETADTALAEAEQRL